MTIYSPNYLESNEFTLTGSAGRIVPADMQDFIDSAFGLSINSIQTGNYTYALSDAGTMIEYNSTSAGTFTISSATGFLVGTILYFRAVNTGMVTIAGSGVTLRTGGSSLTTLAQWGGGYAHQRASNDWVVVI